MKRIIVFLAVLLPLSLVGSATGHAGSPPQPATVLADVKAQGASAVASKLSSDSAEWAQVVASVGQGHPEWLQVAAALRPGTDGGASEALDEAVFLALKSAPIAVLKMLTAGTFEARAVCSSNIGIDYTPAQSKRLIKARIRALEKVSDPSTDASRTQCIAGLHAALADFEKSDQKVP